MQDIELSVMDQNKTDTRHVSRTSHAGLVRLDGLDALRAIAMLLGIGLHAAVAYMPTRMPNLLWSLYDEKQTEFCSFIFWWVHAFRLPIFFVLAGFFSELLFQKRGADGYLKHRIQRLVIPYIFGGVPIIGLTFVVFAYGWFITGRATPAQIVNPLNYFSDDIQNHFFGPAHLWFLSDLIIMSFVYWRLRGEWSAESGSVTPTRLPLGPKFLLPFVFALPTALILRGNIAPFTEFHNTFIPDPSRLLYYGIYFTAGFLFYRHREWFFDSLRYPWTHIALSFPTAFLMLWMIQLHFAHNTMWTKTSVALTVALVSWLSVWGWFGVFIHHWKISSATVRYLSDSSYWMYLIHLPVVAGLHIAFCNLAWSAQFKFLSTMICTTFAGLVSYQLFVRYTIIGYWLHGARQRRSFRIELLPTREASVPRQNETVA